MSEKVTKTETKNKYQQTALLRERWEEVKEISDGSKVQIMQIVDQALAIGLPIIKERFEQLNILDRKVA